MLRSDRPVDCPRTSAPQEAAVPLSEGSPGSKRGWRRGYSSLASAVLDEPLMKRLCRRMRHLAIFAPGVQAVVDRKAREACQGLICSLDRRPIDRRTSQNGARGFHCGALDEPRFMFTNQNFAPGVNLLVNIDFHRTDVGATAVQCGCERQVAIFPRVERRIDDQPDRSRIGSPVAQPA